MGVTVKMACCLWCDDPRSVTNYMVQYWRKEWSSTIKPFVSVVFNPNSCVWVKHFHIFWLSLRYASVKLKSALSQETSVHRKLMWIVQELLNRLSCKSPGSVDSSWQCSPRVLAEPGHNPPGHASGSWCPVLLQITEHFRQETHWNRASWNLMSVEVPHTITLKSYTSKFLRSR